MNQVPEDPALDQNNQREEGLTFTPKFNSDGLIPAIASDETTGEVLMFAWMNAAALEATLATGIAHFWSRSRGRLWRKGEESGNTLHVSDVRTDCDQDVIWLLSTVAGDGVACHTKRRSCFYRRVSRSGHDTTQTLEFIDQQSPNGP